jgi:hypothetical protein
LTGKGKDLLKFQYANYTGALDSFYLRAGFKSGLTRGEFYWPFIDYNGNFVPDWPTPNHPSVKNEFIINDILGHWPTPSDVTMIVAKGQAEQKAWNAAHPGVAAPWDYYTYPGWFYLLFSGTPLGRAAGGAATDGIDSNFGPQRIREMSLSYERQWTTDISMQVIGSYKREYNLEWDRPYDGTLATKVLRSPDTSVNMGKDPVYGWTVYQGQALASPAGYWVTIYKHYYNYFWGGEFILKKRYSHGWMLQASFDYQDWRVHYSPLYINADGSVNPDGEFGRSTLYDYYNKAFVGVYEYGSSEPQQNARWHYKITGLVRLPWDLHFSLFLEGREGFLVDRWMTTYLGQYLPELGTTRGKYRMPSFTYLNLTLDKTLRFSESVSVKLWATAYNATNAVSIQWFNANRAPLPWPIKDFPTSINRPRVVQLGVRFSFL